MIEAGNLFFRYRNVLFILLYAFIFLPSAPIFWQPLCAGKMHYWPLIIGLSISVAGQAIRAATIGLAYIVRGGKDRKVYADHLVTTGIFGVVRNPLYIGNILMLVGLGISANSLVFLTIITPLFLLVYQCIVLAEEAFLIRKFGEQYEQYCRTTNRWIPSFRGPWRSIFRMRFRWKRWLTKEYGTHFIWLMGIAAVIFLNHGSIFGQSNRDQIINLFTVVIMVTCYYLFVRYMKKTSQWH